MAVEPLMSGRRSSHVGRRMMKAALFVTGGRLLLRVLSLLSLMILARLLTPADYGIAALAVVVIGLLQTVSDIRLGQALIGIDDVTPAHLDTAFTLALLRGLLIAAVLGFGAPFFAAFMEQPALTDVLRVLAVVAVIDGFKNPAFLLYRRDIDFSREVNRQAAATVMSVAVTIGAAFLLRSYWAIVLGTVTLRLVEAALTYWRISYVPKLGLARWREFTSFGLWMSIIGICDYVGQTAPQFVIGKSLGSSSLGVYSVGREISTISTRELAMPLMAIVFPGFATIGKDAERLRLAYREVQSTIFGLAFPIGLGCAMLAREFILLLAGAKWLAAVPVIEVLAPLMALGMVNSGTEGLALTKGKSQQLAWRAGFVAIASYPLLIAGVTLGGFQGALIALAIRILVSIIISAWFSSRLAGDSLWSPLAACWRSFIAGFAMCAALFAADPGIDAGAGIGAILMHTLPLVALGALVYAVIHALLWHLAGRPRGFEARLLEFVRFGLRR